MIIYEGGLKSSYDDIILAVDNFLISGISVDNFLISGIQALQNRSIRWTMLKNKPLLVIFHENILVSL